MVHESQADVEEENWDGVTDTHQNHQENWVGNSRLNEGVDVGYFSCEEYWYYCQ